MATAFKVIIATATTIPSCLAGRIPTSFAAKGAASVPPSARPPTIDQLISMRPIWARNPTDAATATTNSAALTVPITFRGSVAVVEISVGVTTGPHPPPPDASIKPPVNPR